MSAKSRQHKQAGWAGFVMDNRKARHNYTIGETLEAGLVLAGPEIKALRAHRAQIDGSYVRIIGGEAWLIGSHIQVETGDQNRSIKLLLHKTELARLIGSAERQGMTILPLRLYEQHGHAKLLIGLGRGKKQYEHRAELKERAENREARRAIKK